MAPPRNCKKCNKPKRPKGKSFKELPGYCKCGRPTVLTPEVLNKLEDAFLNAMSDEQACSYAGISKQTLYNHQMANPEFVDRKEMLKMKPDIKAKVTIVSHLGDPVHAWRWAERRDPDLKPVSRIEHSGSIEVSDLTEEMGPEEKQALLVLRAARRARIEAESKKI